MTDVPGIIRSIAGYNTMLDKNGDHRLEVVYSLQPIPLAFLQELFNISPYDEDAGIRDMIDCYKIDKTQAIKLQPYLAEILDFDRYIFYLECHSK